MKQYDILIGESGGKESHLSQTFQKALDEAYNMGVIHALELVKSKKEHLAGMSYVDFYQMKKDIDYEMNELVEYLVKLKKPTV